MDAVIRLHALPGLPLMGALLLLAGAAGLSAIRGRAPDRWLERARLVLLTLVVIEAALGLVLALRGASPAEWIHWLYGALIIAVLLAPAALSMGRGPSSRSWVLATAGLVGAVLAWRLWGSG